MDDWKYIYIKMDVHRKKNVCGVRNLFIYFYWLVEGIYNVGKKKYTCKYVMCMCVYNCLKTIIKKIIIIIH